MINDQLAPIPMIINQAQAVGVRFGHGNPRVHLAYLTKLRLLPQAVRRKINGTVVGCYPWETVQKLKRIEELKDDGWSYGEIRRELLEPQDQERVMPAVVNQYSGGLAFLVIGLFLGYLAAVVSLKMTPGQQPMISSVQAAAPVVSKPDLPILTSGGNDEPIYVIALPGGNLGKLGKSLINLSN